DRAFEDVGSLAEAFRRNETHFKSPDYSEAAARKDFIDKFWIALGWDVNHDTQSNPYEQEVKVERSVVTGGNQRRADYAFYLAPNFHDVRFYVEAKKPSVDIGTAENYFQLIRYGWNSDTPLAALTDFEQFHILDCRYRPDIETAINRAVGRYHYTDYAKQDKFAEVYWLFSREAVAAGSIEKRVKELPKPRGRAVQRGLFPGGYQSIDETFLAQLDEFRKALALSFKNRNPELNGEALTELAQRTLDRLVFLRFLEDKGIEADRRVENFGDKGTAWEDFIAACRRLDGIYNGVVYKRHTILDSGKLVVDDNVFANICGDLAHANSPYDFNAIPIHILGSIYERFLGKVITASAKRAKVEEKPEVRKAGGVYYTPEYIVRYIVNNTVGKLIEGKTPAQIAKMRFADIACGSGSFLLGVFDLLLKYHGHYYNQNPDKARKDDCVTRDGRLHLSLQKKREILLNNIFGVDIDYQAVEVCQLSLYLKLLQEETEASTHQYLLDFAHVSKLKKLLPDLSKNIVCGNSLIGRDINGDLFEEVEKKLNPMDFEDAFPEVIKHGGFDAVVGNPPYVRIQGFPLNQIEYLTHHYRSARGNCDLYVSFVERGYSLLRENGRFGYIVPNKFFKTDYGEGLRELISSQQALSEIIDFGANQVFEATTYSCLVFLTKRHNDAFSYAQVEASPEALVAPRFVAMTSDSLGTDAWLFADQATIGLLKKLSQNTKRLLDLPAYMSRGSSSGDDEVFVVESTTKIERGILRVPVFATDFNRYTFTPNTHCRIVFPYEVAGDAYRLMSERELKRKFPNAYAYLRSKQAQLRQRKQYAEWYGYSAPRNLNLHDRAQIAVPLLADRGLFALIPKDTRGNLCPMASGGFTITLIGEDSLRSEFVLGLLNSRLLFWYLHQMSNVFRGGWITCTKQYFGELPIAIPDKTHHDRMVAKVEAMLEAKKQLAKAQTDKDKTYYEKKCASLDRQIDRLVYDLYGLTEEEIAVVENGGVDK
ncbi:MAG: N-6 DNA methylase, partial [candidate division Zixibacteria bacterium]|nr:N-6 DNA methylase [candidate division Zixibacteria bacterium]